MDSLMLDGNAVAGLLHDVFGAEMTEATGTCDSCGASAPVGAVHVFRSAGVVLRCPRCGNVLAKIVTRREDACVDLSGLRMLAMRA
jgi:predicted RNA-binding Zn-ribbon protein involved in translation (DUF1610 family)